MPQSTLSPIQFQQLLLDWQKQQGRHDLPWQVNPTPYRVLVSEIMLQQTQVTTVIPYFLRWMERFPHIESLAVAAEDEVMSHWQGLGYYSRARNLKKAAQYILNECAGEFPTTLSELIKIPGVGRYTAGAIASFAYDSYGPIVDGNVKRLFCRFFGIEGIPGTSKVDKALWQKAELYTPNQNNRQFAQGLLDMGATICRPKTPKCDVCHFQPHCLAYTEQRVLQLPTPKPKKTIPLKTGHFLWLQQDGKLLLEKRNESGIWGALWCLPQLNSEPLQIQERTTKQSVLEKGQFKHTFTHYKLEAKVWTLDAVDSTPNPQQWFTAEQLTELGLPTPIKKFILKHL
ncbi:A/G-specific adenine glycosylase [Shewanella gelidii]|uniref:Adenine DNA glycosylase n=1 Tax=Shewanella gelidii TaxID=1642821 RepID=A0A917JJR7_9GAMM|nr:A/G-specific adenine glycosylase [Shewanella gelidii]MCL1097190.1 A/G-specific adenine glycosylase [Shewanella gelidii]GGI73153.1 A/G-specific adenine glycosylase [Shewanella gelidii]